MMAVHKKAPRRTPIRRALENGSRLHEMVHDGIGAIKRSDRDCFAEDIRRSFGDSLELDAALEQDHGQENRWDYLLGHMPSDQIVAVEPHSAKTDQVDTVIRKRAAAKQQLVAHLKPGFRVSKWLWVASGRNHFADTEKARRRLDQNGIEFVGGRVLAKHLPPDASKKLGKRA